MKLKNEILKESIFLIVAVVFFLGFIELNNNITGLSIYSFINDSDQIEIISLNETPIIKNITIDTILEEPILYNQTRDITILQTPEGPNSPTAGENSGSNWANRDNAIADGGGASQATAKSIEGVWWGFDFNIPSGSTINGIEVICDAWTGTDGPDFAEIYLSWDSGGTYTTAKTQTWPTPSESEGIISGSNLDDWGHTWSTAETNGDIFRVKVKSIANGKATTDWNLDWIRITVYYTGDEAAPSFSNATNDTGIKKNNNITMNITITENTAIRNYTLEWNNTGTPANISSFQIAGTYTTWNANTSVNVTAAKGQKVWWRYYSCDSSNNCNVSGAYNFTVANTPPVFDEDLADQTVTTPNSLSYDANCSDIDGNNLIYYINNTLVSINSGTGVISDTPDESETGVYPLKVNCSDSVVNVSQTFIYTVNDGTAPSTSLVTPPDKYWNSSTNSVNFTCSATDGYNLKNISLWITNSTNQSYSLDSPSTITGTSNISTWIKSMSNGNYTWSCLTYDEKDNSDWDVNRTFKINVSDLTAPSFSNAINETGIKKHQNITLNITITDADSNLANYTLEWNDTGTITNVSIFQISGAKTWNANTSVNVTASYNQKVWWRYYACDINNYCNVSATYNFTVNNTKPPQATLDTPANNYGTTNRTPELKWNTVTDIDGQSIIYYLNLTCYANAGGGCNDDRTINTTATSYVPDTELKFFGDDNYHYNWSIFASDSIENGTESIRRNITINTLVSINLVNASVNFTTVLAPGAEANTTDDDPYPLALQNDGNVQVDVNISSQDDLIWYSQPNPSNYFQYKIDNATTEAGSFNGSGSSISWTDVPLSNETPINVFNHTDTNDLLEIDFRVEVPPNEPGGNKTITLIFTGWYVTL